MLLNILNFIYFFNRGGFTRGGPSGPAVDGDAVVVEEDVCKMPPVTPHLRACLAFIRKWTYDFR